MAQLLYTVWRMHTYSHTHAHVYAMCVHACTSTLSLTSPQLCRYFLNFPARNTAGGLGGCLALSELPRRYSVMTGSDWVPSSSIGCPREGHQWEHGQPKHHSPPSPRLRRGCPPCTVSVHACIMCMNTEIWMYMQASTHTPSHPHNHCHPLSCITAAATLAAWRSLPSHVTLAASCSRKLLTRYRNQTCTVTVSHTHPRLS